MSPALNSEQIRGLANFYFDIAKGLLLGSLGIATITPLEVKLMALLPSLLASYFLVRLALSLLGEIK